MKMENLDVHNLVRLQLTAFPEEYKPFLTKFFDYADEKYKAEDEGEMIRLDTAAKFMRGKNLIPLGKLCENDIPQLLDIIEKVPEAELNFILSEIALPDIGSPTHSDFREMIDIYLTDGDEKLPKAEEEPTQSELEVFEETRKDMGYLSAFEESELEMENNENENDNDENEEEDAD